MKDAIDVLVREAADCGDALMAMQFSQAALNVKNIIDRPAGRFERQLERLMAAIGPEAVGSEYYKGYQLGLSVALRVIRGTHPNEDDVKFTEQLTGAKP